MKPGDETMPEFRLIAEGRMHDSLNCPICRGLPRNGSISDGEFSDLLARCRAELAFKQTRLQQYVDGATQWRYAMAEGLLVIGETHFGMTPIGTFSADQQTWLWAWANEEFPESARADSRRIQELHTLTGFQVFVDPGIHATTADAQDFSALAVHQLGAIGLFCCPSDGQTPALYLAVHPAEKS